MRSIKRLNKRYPNIVADLKKLEASLQINPTQGISLGDGLYKIRMAITDKNTGKSGGARVITYYLGDDVLTLIFIYDKSEMASVSKQDLLALVQSD